MMVRLSDLPIRTKLALLVGVPLLGALALSLVIFLDVAEKAQRARALGSLESLAELCTRIGEVEGSLHREQARLAMDLGRAAKSSGDLVNPTPVQLSDATLRTMEESRAAVRMLDAFLSTRHTSRLPLRVAQRLESAQSRLQRLESFRNTVAAKGATLQEVLEVFDAPVSALTAANAALGDLSEDVSLLRLITATTALLDFGARAGEEHTLLTYVFSAAEFPPGSYRKLVTLLTEEETFHSVIATNATAEQLAKVDSALQGPSASTALGLRQAALDSADEELKGDANEWFAAQGVRVKALIDIGRELNGALRSAALAKQATMNRAILVGSGLAGGVLFFGIVMGALVTRGILSSVRTLTQATRLIGQGDLSVRAAINARDELGALGRAFDDMVEEIDRSRAELGEKARMQRELEIAAALQISLLPPAPTHPEFTFSGRMLPADEVGGDFYDVLWDPLSNRLWITIGDVSSHGLGSGLVMMMTQAAFSAHFRATPNAPPGQVLTTVNALLIEAVAKRLRDDKYVTAQLLQYEGNGDFLCGGGHQSPLVWRAATRRAQYVEMGGPWLGLVPALPEVDTDTLHLEVGDVLCLYSDGITEARNEMEELFEPHRLASALEAAMDSVKDFDHVADEVIATVNRFTTLRHDDWTLLLVRREKAGSPGGDDAHC